MQRTLGLTMMMFTLGLVTSGGAAAQQCETDADCGEGMRCEVGLVRACESPPCEEGGEAVPGNCVDALLGAACSEDADCGELTCAKLLVAVSCSEEEPDCAPEEGSEEGFCADDASLASSSGLAPEVQASSSTDAPVASSGDGAAGGASEQAPSASESAMGADDGNTGGADSGCSIAGGQTGGLSGLAPWSLALLWLGKRARRRAA